MNKASQPPDSMVTGDRTGVYPPVSTTLYETFRVDESLAYSLAMEAVERVTYPLHQLRYELGEKARTLAKEKLNGEDWKEFSRFDRPYHDWATALTEMTFRIVLSVVENLPQGCHQSLEELMDETLAKAGFPDEAAVDRFTLEQLGGAPFHGLPEYSGKDVTMAAARERHENSHKERESKKG